MSTLFYGINAGAEQSTATIATSTTGKDVEVAINSVANVPTRDVLRVALEKLQSVIDQSSYTPV
jgi:hypothetical protein